MDKTSAQPANGKEKSWAKLYRNTNFEESDSAIIDDNIHNDGVVGENEKGNLKENKTK